MRIYLLTILGLVLISCQAKQSSKEDKIPRDTSSMEKDLMVGDYKLVSKLPDTSTIEQKIEYFKIQIMNMKAIETLGEIEDTMFDINYDGTKDLILKYPMMHLGFETSVYNMNADNNSFSKNQALWGLPNVTFDIKSKRITSYYHGPNTGSGIRLEWEKGQWDTTMSYSVENTMDLATWDFYYHKTKKRKKGIRRSYSQGFPNDI